MLKKVPSFIAVTLMPVTCPSTREGASSLATMTVCLFALYAFGYPLENRSAFRQFLTTCYELLVHGPQDYGLQFYVISAS